MINNKEAAGRGTITWAAAQRNIEHNIQKRKIEGKLQEQDKINKR